MDLEPWCQNPQILHHWFEVERLTDSRRFVLLTVRFSKVDPCLKKQKQKTIREQKYLSWAPVSVRGTPAAPSLRGYRRSQRNSLPSTLVRVSTGLLQADSGATLAECFFMMMSSDGQSSEPLRLHPWGWFGADTRPLDGTLDVSRAGVLLSVPSHPSNLLFLIFLSLPLPSLPLSLSTSVGSPHPLPPLPSPDLLYPVRPGRSLLHVQFGDCCNSPTSRSNQLHNHVPPPIHPPPFVVKLCFPPTLPAAAIPPGQSKVCMGVSRRSRWPGDVR